MSKDDGPPPQDPNPHPRKKTIDKGSRKKSKKSEDKGKGKPPPLDKGKPPHTGKGKPPPGGKGKPPPAKKGKPPPAVGSKKLHTKKKGHTIYSELKLNSSEENEGDEASKLRDNDFALAADLGWDPTAYYPDAPEVTRETTLSKLIDLRGELSSPVMMLQISDRDDCRLCQEMLPYVYNYVFCMHAAPLPTKHKKKHHHHQSRIKKPLY